MNSRTSVRGYRSLDHTADLALEIWAPSETALLEEAARAAVSMMTEGAEIVPDSERTVHLDTLDAEDRLVQWVNEVIYWAVVEGFLVKEAALTLSESGLEGCVRGVESAFALVKGELKSATYHDLELNLVEGRALARLIIDV